MELQLPETFRNDKRYVKAQKNFRKKQGYTRLQDERYFVYGNLKRSEMDKAGIPAL